MTYSRCYRSGYTRVHMMQREHEEEHRWDRRVE